jgi:phosphatidylglycerophosphatase GEP4
MSLQYFNLEAIKFTVYALFKRPSWLIPHVKVTDLGDIRYSKLKERGIKAVIFDKDNTLTAPYQSAWFNARIQDCMNDCKLEFGASNVAICSNTAGSKKDRLKQNYADAEALQVILGLKVIKHDINKPNTPLEEIMSHFESQRAAEIGKYERLRPDEIAIIGDRLVGDILWGNSLGMLTIKTAPLTVVGENFAVRWARRAESSAESLLRTLRVKAPVHRLAPDVDALTSDITFPTMKFQ